MSVKIESSFAVADDRYVYNLDLLPPYTLDGISIIIDRTDHAQLSALATFVVCNKGSTIQMNSEALIKLRDWLNERIPVNVV